MKLMHSKPRCVGGDMSKLINAYRKMPNSKNRIRLMDYLLKHPMAICMATDEEREFLKVHNFT